VQKPIAFFGGGANIRHSRFFPVIPGFSPVIPGFFSVIPAKSLPLA